MLKEELEGGLRSNKGESVRRLFVDRSGVSFCTVPGEGGRGGTQRVRTFVTGSLGDGGSGSGSGGG
jgi:hypothetical protein